METVDNSKNNTPTNKKISKKKIFIILLLIIVVVAMVGIVIMYIQHKEIKLPKKNMILTSNFFKSESANKNQDLGKSETSSLEDKNNEQILELENKIQELKNELELSNMRAQDYSYSLSLLHSNVSVAYKLKTGEPFHEEIDSLINLTKSPTLKVELEKIKPYSTQGVKTTDTLIKEYQKVYQSLLINQYKSDNIWLGKVKALLLYLIFIKKDQKEISQRNSIKDTLGNIELYLILNDLDSAYIEIKKLEITDSVLAKQWVRDLQERIQADITITKLEEEINKYKHSENQ